MRKTDADEKTRFRSADRVFQANDKWWFGTREEDRGPFNSRKEAEGALAQFILDIRADFDLDDVSILDKDDSISASAWDTRPDVIR